MGKKSKKAPQSASKQLKLKTNWELFCVDYATNFNATQAAIKAGATENSARTIGYRLLKNVHIQKRIEELTEGRNQRILLQGDEILGELKRIGDFDPRIIFGENGEIKDPKDWPIDLAKCIASIEVKEILQPFTGKVIGYTKKVKFCDKLKALELLGKNKKLFIDVTESTGQMNHTVAVIDKAEAKRLLKELDDEY